MNKKDNLTDIIKNIKNRFGSDAIMQLDESCKEKNNIDVISTGSLNLDISLGIGGLPKGRIIEIFGPESSGKTTIALHILSSLKETKKKCAFIDLEHALDIQYAKNIGVDISNMLFSQPNSGEEALEILELLIISKKIEVIIIDSVAALVPKAELEGKISDMHIGLQARLMSKVLRKITGYIKKNNVLVIFINQIRMKIGLLFGNPETTSGGNALKFYSSVRLDIRRISYIKKENEIVGNRVRIKIVKNKLSIPFKITEIDIFYNKGIIKEYEILDISEKINLIEKKGSWYKYNDQRIGQGKESAYLFLKKNKNITEHLVKKIKEYYKI